MPNHATSAIRLRSACLTDRQYRAAAARLLRQIETWTGLTPGGPTIKVDGLGGVLRAADGGAFVEATIFVPEAEALREER